MAPLALRPLGADAERRNAFGLLAKGGPAALASLPERFQRDRDVVLAAVAQHPSALLHAHASLRDDRSFALEAVLRNCRCLEFLPEAQRADRAVVLQAIAQKKSLLQHASQSLQQDMYLSWEAQALREAELPSFEGEALRLVGFCNRWRTDDADLRFQRASLPPGEEGGSVRQVLRAHLAEGNLAFQVLSVTRLSALRLFPVGSKLLRAGDREAVEAAVGDKRGGHGQNFEIQEQPGSVVAIYVQLLYGAARRLSVGKDGVGCSYVCRGTSIWYEVERGFAGEVVSLSEPAEREEAKRAAKALPQLCATGLDGALGDRVKAVVVDEYFKSKFKDVLIQAREMGERTFPERWRIRDLHGDRRMLLLVDAQCTRAIAYCLFTQSSYGRQGVYVKEFVVNAMHRGKGFGKALFSWLLKQLRQEACPVVHLHSFNSAVSFYKKLGFEEARFTPVAGCTALALRLEGSPATAAAPAG